MTLGLTQLGLIHTAGSLAAVVAGVVAFWRAGAISLRTSAGKIYVVTTILSCLTGFGIFEKGGVGPPHVLGIVTLIVIAAAIAAERGQVFGRASVYVQTVAYSLTFFFHMIPGFRETSTRLPASAPLASGREDPGLQAAIGAAFVVFLIGATIQVIWLRRNGGPRNDARIGDTRRLA
jgi:uncharacterized membrane protein